MSAYCHDAAWAESAPLFGCVYSVGQNLYQLLVIAPIPMGFYIILISFPPKQTLRFLSPNSERGNCQGIRFHLIFLVGNIEAV